MRRALAGPSVSPCCNYPVRVAGKGMTHWYECTKCGKACDPVASVSAADLGNDPEDAMTPEERAVLEAALKVADQCYDEPSRHMQHSAIVDCADAVQAYRQSLKPKPRHRVVVMDRAFCVEDLETARGLVIADCGRLGDWAERICRLLNEDERSSHE